MTETASSTGWHGELRLAFRHRHGQTIPHNPHATAPLKLQRPFYPDVADGPTSCHSVIVHTAGGMVGGDRLSLQIAAEAHTHALVTTAAAHKVYRSRGPVARQTTQLQVATAASLDWLPQETIIFDGAQYHQSIRVELMPGAIWCGWDLVRFGRSARGEAFLTGHWRTATEVWRQGAPLWIDRQWLAGGSEGLYSRHGLAGYPVIASFVMIGAEITADHIDMARSLWPMAPGDAGVTRLLAGLLCRYRGPSTQQARAWFTQVWQTLKPQLAQVSAQPSRVWG